MTVKVGFPWSMSEFIEKALQKEHPFSGSTPLPPDVAHAIVNILTKGPSEIKRGRQQTLAWIRARASELQSDED